MFFQSNEFKLLESGTNLAWIGQELHMQNIANIETPGYKSKGLVFREVLQQTSGENKTKEKSIQAQIVENDALSTRPDGNNVDLETENIELYKSYAQYSMMLEKIKGQFNRYNTVLNSNMR